MNAARRFVLEAYPATHVFDISWRLARAGLLLRATLGAVSVAQGALFLAHWNGGSEIIRLAGVGCLLAGLVLVIGYMTPAGAILYLLIALYVLLFNPPEIAYGSNPMLSILVSISIAISVLCLGPGAFSADAGRFGRRDIVIPTSSHPPRHRQ